MKKFQEILHIKMSQKWSHDPIISGLVSLQQQAVCLLTVWILLGTKQHMAAPITTLQGRRREDRMHFCLNFKLKDEAENLQGSFRCVRRIYLMVSWDIWRGKRERDIVLETQERVHLSRWPHPGQLLSSGNLKSGLNGWSEWQFTGERLFFFFTFYQGSFYFERLTVMLALFWSFTHGANENKPKVRVIKRPLSSAKRSFLSL